MTFWKSYLNSARSAHVSMSAWSPLPSEVELTYRGISWLHSSLSACSRSLGTFLSRLSLAYLFLALLLVMGLLYGSATSLADWLFAVGGRGDLDTKVSVEYLRIAGRYNPFNHDERMASANVMAFTALQTNDKGWLKAAKAEIAAALEVDSTDANLLLKGILVDLQLDDIAQAKIYYDRFQQVNRKSPIMKLVAQSHQQGSRAVAADP